MSRRIGFVAVSLRQSLLCWPCLLFRLEVSQSCTETGYRNMHGYFSDSSKHEKSMSHFEAYKMWKAFDTSEREYVLFSRARKEEIERHNEEVRINRNMLRILFESVLFPCQARISISCPVGIRAIIEKCLKRFDSILCLSAVCMED